MCKTGIHAQILQQTHMGGVCEGMKVGISSMFSASRLSMTARNRKLCALSHLTVRDPILPVLQGRVQTGSWSSIQELKDFGVEAGVLASLDTGVT